MPKENKPKFQRNLENFLFIVSLVFLIFTGINGFSRAVDFVTFNMAIVGSLLVILVSSISYYFLPLRWKTRGGIFITITKFGVRYYLSLLSVFIALWIPPIFKYYLIGEKNETQEKREFKSIFPENDSTSFNVLILPFEDVKEDAKWIGRKIEISLSYLKNHKDLPLALKYDYPDTIQAPKDDNEAILIQNRHHADLVIFGFAEDSNTDSTRISFNYNISENVISKITPIIKVTPLKYKYDYIFAKPLEIEKGMFNVENLVFQKWIKAIVKIKANEHDKAFLELDEILNDTTKNKSERSSHAIAIGFTYLKLKQFSLASNALSLAISLNPENELAFYNRAVALGYFGKLDEAIRDYEKVIFFNPENVFAYVNMGSLNGLKKEYKKAIDLYNIAISKDSLSELAFFNRAVAFVKLDQKRNAIRDYGKAASLNPKNVNAFLFRGINHKELLQYKEAILDFDTVILLDKNNVSAYQERGVSFGYLHKYKEAISDFDKVIQLDQNNAPAYNNRGFTFASMKQYNKAIKDFDKAISLNQNFFYAYFNRGNTKAKLKLFREAIPDYKNAISLDPVNTEVYNSLIFCQLKTKNLDAAIKNLEKLESLDPDNSKMFILREMPEFKELILNAENRSRKN